MLFKIVSTYIFARSSRAYSLNIFGPCVMGNTVTVCLQLQMGGLSSVRECFASCVSVCKAVGGFVAPSQCFHLWVVLSVYPRRHHVRLMLSVWFPSCFDFAGISVTPDSRSRLPRKSPRTRRATLPPRLQPPTLSPAPRDLQEFLCRHRPRDEASDGGSHSRSVHHIILSNGMSYEGQLGSDGMPNGWGILTMQDGVIYEGTWRRGQVHGPGSLRLPNGNAFWGAWSDGQKQGMGTFMWADGSRYEGLYRGGKRSGYGTLLYVSQAIYKGNFECDLRHGSGRLTLPCGSYYDGQWVTDIPHGHGVYVEAGTNGERFEGSWHKGVRCGAGTLVQGAQEAADGTESRASSGSAWYSGNFEAGLPHGNGAMGYGRATFCGHIERGMWTGGGGRVDLGDEAGSFEGMWHNGLPQGRGRWCSSPNGTEVDATFKEGYSKLT